MKANLFLLPKLILNPGGKLTLNIFEERYLALLEDCLQNGTPMAIGHASGEKMEESCEVYHEKFHYVFEEVSFGDPQVLTETAEGSKLIVVNAKGKGRISHCKLHPAGYNEVDLEEVRLSLELSSDKEFLYRRLKTLTREKVGGLLKNEREVDLLMDNLKTPHELVAFYADHILKPFETRLRVFRENDLNQKIKLLGEHLVA